MSEEPKRINYNLAKAEADKVDEQIIAALQNGNSFRVEAGAGSGKTYSLNKVIEWIQENKWAEYRRKKQTVICITYLHSLFPPLYLPFLIPIVAHFFISCKDTTQSPSAPSRVSSSSIFFQISFCDARIS